jgi:hypothetical protein
MNVFSGACRSDRAPRTRENHDGDSQEGGDKASRKSPQGGSKPCARSQSGPDEAAAALKELGEVVGSDPLPRPRWSARCGTTSRRYELQNPQNKREILADDKLEAVFGKKKVTMFEMNKHLAAHLK